MLTISIVAGNDPLEDVLSVQNQGSAVGQIGFDGVNVSFGGTNIGTAAGGAGGADLVITLNANATPVNVSALAQRITYTNTDVAAPTPGDYAIHLESAGSESSVQSSWDQLRATYPAQIADKSLLVREVDLGDRGVFYRILAGPFADASAADTACRKLEGLGQYCAVYSFE